MLIRAISSVVERLPYKEEVAGSNPASPTYKTPAKTVFCGQGERAGKTLPGSLTATVLQPELCPSHELVPKAVSIASTAESCMSGSTWE